MSAEQEAEHLEKRLLDRMLFFTDAVFAIVLTILVLELKPPEGPLQANAETLRRMAPHIGAFVFSFFINSLWLTPNRCSSSTTSSPRSLNLTDSCRRR